jgi:hypothetical protein
MPSPVSSAVVTSLVQSVVGQAMPMVSGLSLVALLIRRALVNPCGRLADAPPAPPPRLCAA